MGRWELKGIRSLALVVHKRVWDRIWTGHLEYFTRGNYFLEAVCIIKLEETDQFQLRIEVY